MKNHNCPFSNSCKYYTNDNCQGCNYAARKKLDSTTGMLQDLARRGYTVDMERDSFNPYVKVTVRRGYECVTRNIEASLWGTAIGNIAVRNMVKELSKDITVAEPTYPSCHDSVTYSKEDIRNFMEVYNIMNKKFDKTKPGWSIKNVIFSDPATIVLWEDGTKTVVKCENEAFDPEKGLAMALAKKMLGNKGNYFNVFKKWIPEEKED